MLRTQRSTETPFTCHLHMEPRCSPTKFTHEAKCQRNVTNQRKSPERIHLLFVVASAMLPHPALSVSLRMHPTQIACALQCILAVLCPQNPCAKAKESIKMEGKISRHLFCTDKERFSFPDSDERGIACRQAGPLLSSRLFNSNNTASNFSSACLTTHKYTSRTHK